MEKEKLQLVSKDSGEEFLQQQLEKLVKKKIVSKAKESQKML